jgi:hypothetical protein
MFQILLRIFALLDRSLERYAAQVYMLILSTHMFYYDDIDTQLVGYTPESPGVLIEKVSDVFTSFDCLDKTSRSPIWIDDNPV